MTMDLDVDHIRKVAALERGRRAFEGESVTRVPAFLEFLADKVATADPELIRIADWLDQDYEALGGRYGDVR